MLKESRRRTVADRVRDSVLVMLVLAMGAHLVPVVFAAWDKTKPANNSALLSSEIRANWTSLESAIGNPDSTLQIKASNFTVLPTGFGMPTRLRVTTDVTKNNSTVFGDVTALGFAIAANEEWEFRCRLKVVGTTVANSKWQLTGPAAPTGLMFGVISGVTPTATNHQAAAAFSSAIEANLAGTSNTELLLLLDGNVRNGANAGTVQLQFAQLAAEASNLTVRAESYCIPSRMN